MVSVTALSKLWGNYQISGKAWTRDRRAMVRMNTFILMDTIPTERDFNRDEKNGV